MADNKNSNLFDSLTNLGFGNLDEISIYGTIPEDKTKPKLVKPASPEDGLFERKVECPVCHKNISIPSVKSSSIRTLSKDSDFMIYFGEPNPMFYDAWVCTNCGYAAFSSRFSTLTEKQKKLIKDGISVKWDSRKTYPLLHDVNIAIEKHQIVLLNTIVKVGKDSEKAMTCLKLGWLYRLKKDVQGEFKFLEQAKLGFIKALEKESAPIAGLDEPSLEYLIGELYRRLGDNSNALLWFSRVLSNKLTKPKIKDMARDQKDIIRDQKDSVQCE